jgi:hypothetical protein
MSHPTATHSAQNPNGSEATVQDQAKLLEALRQHSMQEQFKQYQAQKIAQPETQVISASMEEEGDHSVGALGNKKINEIKDILRSQGKRVTGNKEDLIAVCFAFVDTKLGRDER